MNAVEFRQLVDEDEALVLGAPVVVRWTSCYRAFRANGHVSKVNRKSILVRLDHEILIDGKLGYPEGHEIMAPRLADFKRWTANNCARPRSEEATS
jgi:hypothetical protein